MRLSKIEVASISRMLSVSSVDLFDQLGIRTYHSNKKCSGCCPIHGGRNPSSFNFWLTGDAPGTWSCYSNKCHYEYGKSGVGLIAGVKKLSQESALNWALEFLGKSLNDIKLSATQEEMLNFASYYNKPKVKEKSFDPSILTDSLIIPSPFYLDRFKRETLSEFQVGDCKREGKEMSGRVVVPIFDSKGKNLLGCTGRIKKDGVYPKWLNSKSLNSSQVLFNYHRAVKSNDGSIIVCEGPMDVIRLHEFGVFNAVALLGSDIRDGQVIELEKSGVSTLKMLLDNDDAGRKGVEQAKSLSRSFNLFFGRYEGKDPGEMKKWEVKWEKM